MMTKVIPTDVYDKDGHLIRIDFYNLSGEFEIQSNWDDNDEQTSENREQFREWSYRMVKRLNFEVLL